MGFFITLVNMNMNNNPTSEQLKELIASVDDNAGDHCLWIDNDGNVHLDLATESWPNMRMKIATFEQGENYCGQEVSEFILYMKRLMTDLINKWG